MLVVVVVNYLNVKETTRLPKMSTAEGQKVDNNKVVGIGNSGTKPLYY